jgi:HD superfamily phosphohydrolase
MKIIRDPLWKNISIADELFEACKTKAFIRLQNIRQLGPTFLTYPGATHTRAAHSLGVYHVAMKLLDSLCKKGADTFITESGKKSFFAAALFHDIGHFPYTHSLKELSLEEHETLSARSVLTPELSGIIYNYGAEPEQVAAIIDHNLHSDSETMFYRKLLSGVLDPDKLDYLNRDAFYCGVPYGIQDTDRILQSTIPDKNNGIKILPEDMLNVENILFSKYMMYKAVYWHKNVRIATALMKKALHSAITKKILFPEELYQLDDYSVFSLLHSRNKFDEYKCVLSVENNQLYKTVFEIPFDETNTLHLKLENLDYRSEYEKELSQKLKLENCDLLIDVPERISFESSLLIPGSTVFSSKTVQDFTINLRKIRIAVKPEYSEAIMSSNILIEKSDLM